MTFDEVTIQRVWEKGRVVPGYDSTKHRKDPCDAWMTRSEHGNRNSTYGWEVDHVNPNGGDYLSNLQPLQWQNNCAKSDGRLACAVTSNGNQNIAV